MSVPRGFFETTYGCDSASPAFVRGVLIDQAQYNSMSPAQVQDIQTIPRWTLYGGPLPTRDVAEAWATYMSYWAMQNGKVWLDPSTCCIVRSDQIKWPPDASFQWTWVYEPTYPQLVTRVWDGSQYKWVNA